MVLTVITIGFVLLNGAIANEINTEELNGGSFAVLDCRADVERELDGYMPRAKLIPLEKLVGSEDFTEEEVKKFRVRNGRQVVIIPTEEGMALNLIEASLKEKLNVTDVRVYREGMAAWKAAGGEPDYPKTIGFEALRRSLASANPVTLIDVRNRTELNEFGQIPGSVCLPLHEVRKAFFMDMVVFEETYGFKWPDSRKWDYVLTCRSGRRVKVADRILKRLGYNKMRIYEGSFLDWVANGGELVQANFDVDY